MENGTYMINFEKPYRGTDLIMKMGNAAGNLGMYVGFFNDKETAYDISNGLAKKHSFLKGRAVSLHRRSFIDNLFENLSIMIADIDSRKEYGMVHFTKTTNARKGEVEIYIKEFAKQFK